MQTRKPEERVLPFSWLWPIGAGALSGIALRLLFSGTGDAYQVMSTVFIFSAPVVVGAVTVYVAETRKRRTWGYYIAASFVATCLAVIGTLLILVEGLICAVVIAPLFAALGMVGGLLMGVVCRFTSWPKPTASCIVLLPLALGGLGLGPELPQDVLSVERTVVVRARPDVVWRELLDARDIRAEEVQQAWAFRIGSPLPLEGRLLEGAPERVRRVRMTKNVYFDEVIMDFREHELVRWTYRFYEDSFPPNAFDEHVVIGGKYFDVIDTSYTLTRAGDSTEVRMRVGYRVSTPFNWYTKPVLRWLLGDLLESNLDYYRRRSERPS
jgi:hypothetical protein